jgi:hypothetical protein
MTSFVKRMLPIFVFLCAFLLGPWQTLSGLERIPGNIGDSRLNNYFLENAYLFFMGMSESLWHLPFFYPAPWVLGFSDNLFGSAPVYAVFRMVGLPSDTAFQMWFYAGYVVNFTAAYWALRRIGGSQIAAAVGAMIFAFALPTMSHMGHVQLHYRAGIPIALLLFAQSVAEHGLKPLIWAVVAVVWQFYAGVYMGFFVLLIMALMLVALCLSAWWTMSDTGLRALSRGWRTDWQSRSRSRQISLAAGFVGLMAALVLLFWPYLQVSIIYGGSRDWESISSMLPRPQSYFLSDQSVLWSSLTIGIGPDIPMRHEHQMFIGLMPLLLALLGLFVAFKTAKPRIIYLMITSTGLIMLITLYVGNVSLWYLFHWLPLASAIRAMTRFDQVILFPVAVLAVLSIDYLRASMHRLSAALAIMVILALSIYEIRQYTPGSSAKSEWRSRMAAAEAAYVDMGPADLANDAVIFIAQRDGPFYADELDVMWLSLARNVTTMNGYSGNAPAGASLHFRDDCSEISRRIVGYQDLFPEGDLDNQYRRLISRVVPIGFGNCDPQMWSARQLTNPDAPFSSEQARAISYTVQMGSDSRTAIVTLRNNGPDSFAAGTSPQGSTVRLSWRYLDENDNPMSEWETRRDLPRDIGPFASLDVPISLSIPTGAKSLSVSIVQELIFWFHDSPINTMPAVVSLR